ncbi:MAG: NAD-dependent epimerase/dehydratase family protein [Pseudomonadota bacterium]
MIVNVIGGSGFIGSRLVNRLLSNGLKAVVLDKVASTNRTVQCNIVNVNDCKLLSSSLASGSIINLAAEHRDDVTPKTLYDEVNVEGARNVCIAAEVNNIRTIVFTSSVAVYGFAPLGTDESGTFSPFNDYGRTKLEAEYVYREWQSRDPESRSLVIVRPTVVFGEGNRGNVYNLLKQISAGFFLMVGTGRNLKSMAYVENLSAFLEHALSFGPGVHVHNYVDKPDLDMNTLVATVYAALRKTPPKFRLPYSAALLAGKCLDTLSLLSGRKFPISSIRVKKFCSNTMFNTNVSSTGFVAPVELLDAFERTIRYEFVDDNTNKQVFYTE